jgi:hypothetical protein
MLLGVLGGILLSSLRGSIGRVGGVRVCGFFLVFRVFLFFVGCAFCVPLCVLFVVCCLFLGGKVL